MGILTDRVGQGLEGLSAKFKERLRGWAASFIGLGIEVFMDVMAKSASKSLAPVIEKLERETTIPEEIKPLFDEIKAPSGEFAAVLATRLGNGVVGSALDRFIDYLTRPITLGASYIPDFVLMKIENAIALYRRHEMDFAELEATAHKHGLSTGFLNRLLTLSELRFPSDIAIPLAKRDPAKWGFLLDDILQLGVDPRRYEALLEFFYKIPGVQDVIRYAVREAYSPDIYKAFGQDAEFPTEALEDAEKAGVRPDHLLKEWIAHWELPGVTQGYEMLHRGLVTKEQLQLLLKARDIMPFWRDKLIGLSYDIPNRIELRMMARYGLIDKTKLVEILLKGGVDPQYVDLIADMNLAIGLITDLRTRYSNGYITAEQIRSELQAAGLSPDIQNRLYQYIVKIVKPERTAAEKNLTKAEIIKGVKLGIITWEDGIAELVQMGYDEAEAAYILAINIEVSAGSPHNLGDFKRLTELHRAASGLPTERPVEEIITSEKAVAAKYPVEVKLSEEEIKTRVDTARRRRRRRETTRDEEVTALLSVGLDISLATAYAENDDLRLQKGVGE